MLLKEMGTVSKRLRAGGISILSGFFESDLDLLNAEAGKHGLLLTANRSMNRWTVAVYRKGD